MCMYLTRMQITVRNWNADRGIPVDARYLSAPDRDAEPGNDRKSVDSPLDKDRK